MHIAGLFVKLGAAFNLLARGGAIVGPFGNPDVRCIGIDDFDSSEYAEFVPVLVPHMYNSALSDAELSMLTYALCRMFMLTLNLTESLSNKWFRISRRIRASCVYLRWTEPKGYVMPTVLPTNGITLKVQAEADLKDLDDDDISTLVDVVVMPKSNDNGVSTSTYRLLGERSMRPRDRRARSVCWIFLSSRGWIRTTSRSRM
ncbi:hypothetical protein R1flu_009656 [Riccia fluitans]|uniref:Uncharacterized protein n=1 Tax=Riccia fluitans TaxID=41844 RepID=A0ABD1Z3T8_9MARC